jgi:ABC-type Fe3+/spermidine/putrescine transport system ATPase subunit
MSSSAAVEIDGLRKEFGDVTALDGVSFDVRDGEFFTLVGPSGCGKTTLLRILAGLERETEGTVHINGQDMTGTPAENRPTSMVVDSNARTSLPLIEMGSSSSRSRICIFLPPSAT